MTTRRQEREWALQMLFQFDFNAEEVEQRIVEFWADKTVADRERNFVESLVRGVIENREKIDALLKKYAEHWDVARMGGVDRNVMRIAMYEMVYRDDIPPVVSINEAVDIVKLYGDTDSGKFVNGILDRARKDLDRPARSTRPQGPPT